MYVVHSVNIQLGNYTARSLNSVEIERSVLEPLATCTLKIPKTAVIKRQDEAPAPVDVPQVIQAGDAVNIELGYNGNLKQEFNGFVKRVNHTIPVSIECENHMYLLRKKYMKKVYTETTLKDVLTDVVAGTGISLSNEIPNMPIDSLEILSESGGEVERFDVLNELKDMFGLSIYFDMDGTLYAGLMYARTLDTVKYRIGENTLNLDSLKYHSKEEQKVKIKAVHFDNAGEKYEAEFGDGDGELRTLFFYDVKDTATLEKLAQQALNELSFDGYRGEIETALQPFSQPGDIAKLEDPVFDEYNGDYFIESIRVSMSESGARRTINIGIKL